MEPPNIYPAAAPSAPLQEIVPTQVLDPQEESRQPEVPTGVVARQALQDLLQQQPVVLIGLLAHLSDSTLQDDIAQAGRRLLQLGHDVLSGGGA